MSKLLTIEEFGAGLLETGDLDPVYSLLHGSALTPSQKEAWCFAYWCFYHVGTASWILDGGGPAAYWERFMQAAINTGLAYPRGAERRHFRGDKCVLAAADYRRKWAENPAQPAREAEGNLLTVPTHADIMARVQNWPQFGPWIAFKVADMLERCLDCPVDFSGFDLHMYSTPVKGAVLLSEMKLWKTDAKDPKLAVVAAVDFLLDHFKGRTAPPDFRRPLGVQEAETILCKWKSHMGGHYHVGKDIAELRHALTKFDSPTTLALREVHAKLWPEEQAK